MKFSQGPTSSIAWTSVTGKPEWASTHKIFQGIGFASATGRMMSLQKSGPVSTTWYRIDNTDITQFFADSAAGATTDFQAARLQLDFAKVSVLQSAYFHAKIAVETVTSVTDINARLYNITGAAAITGSTVTQSTLVADTIYDLISGDIAANLPTTGVVDLTAQIMQTNTIARTMEIYLAELILYT